MTNESFFQSDDVRALLEAGCVAASMPVSVHAYAGGSETKRLAGAGGCATCKHVSEVAGGAEACQSSRAQAAARAIQRRRVVPFVCHLGFSCVSVPALPDTDACAITLGPFCPSEAPEALDVGVREGLMKLGHTSNRVITLNDVARVSARSAPIMAEWIADRLATLWTAFSKRESIVSVEPASEMFEEGAPSPGRRRAPTPTGPAALIVAAMAADERATAGRFMRASLEEAFFAAPTKSFAPVQARAVAVVSQALEAAEKARLPTASAWAAFPGFAADSRTAPDIPALSKAAMQVLRLLRRDDRHPEREFQIVLREVDARIDEPIRLDDLAARLGKHPTAITHLFQRRIGLNFSEFVGKLRVEKSKELLRRTQLGVGEVARRVGVRDASNFGRLFRKFEGVSPQQYRERLHQRP